MKTIYMNIDTEKENQEFNADNTYVSMADAKKDCDKSYEVGLKTGGVLGFTVATIASLIYFGRKKIETWDEDRREWKKFRKQRENERSKKE